ncbi:MAG: TldD/PmbA family protein [Actinomycetota bacterium]|nr:TldD/PmbA family protein [Actinomycetota bacterium]
MPIEKMIDIGLARGITKKALGKGEYSDLFIQRRETVEVRFEDGKVDDVDTGLDFGAGIRTIAGNLVAYTHTDIVDEEHLELAALTTSRALLYSKERVVLETPPQPCAPVANNSARHSKRKLPHFKNIVEKLESCDKAARSLSNAIVQFSAVHVSQVEEWLYVDSQGETCSNAGVRSRLAVEALATDGKIFQVGREATGRLEIESFYENFDPLELSTTAAKRALLMLEARPAPTGRMSVVVNSGAGGVMIHEACGHGLEADHVQRHASVYEGKIGTKIAGEAVGVMDDPTKENLWGSYALDDEGTKPRGTLLIENGILKNFLYAKHEAMKDSRQSTGNGRRQSFRYPPIPRMSNTYLMPSEIFPQEIISSTPKGLYAKKMGGGQVDPVTGDYVFGVSEGYLIENGKIGQPVRGAILIGNGPKTLQTIDLVANDLSFEDGTCGKDGQEAPVTTGCPTFRIAELTVGGTEL